MNLLQNEQLKNYKTMIDKAYKDWLIGLKGKIRSAQLKAAVTVNTELITLYWDLGK